MKALVIGAGANELVAAHYLARAGHQVLVLNPRSGDQDELDEPGWVPLRIARALSLGRRGLMVHYPDPWTSAALPDGGRLELWHDMAGSVAALRKLSPRDAAKWPQFCERMTRLSRLLETVYTASPPAFTSKRAGDLAQLAGLGLKVRRLGRQGMEDLLRFLPMSVADLLDDNFESHVLKGLLGAAGVTNLCQGPRSGGTAFRLLHHHVGNRPGVFRPPHSNLSQVLIKLPGIEIRNGTPVGGIVVREGRVTGVKVANGEEISADLVLSGADPGRTLLELVDPGWLDPVLARAVRNIRSRGVAARVTLAVDRAPGHPTFVVAPSLDYVERAYDDAKHGRVSRAPWLEARSVGKTADGRHKLAVRVQYAPYALADGEWDDDRRRVLGDIVLKVLSAHGADLGSAIVERVLSPRDLEQEYGFPEGQEEHAEPALDQLFWMRPVPQLARYRTPIAGLYLCGPGTHPGGGIAGASGHNAAREIMRDLRRGQVR